MQQPEAYLGNVTDDKFDEDGCLKDGPLKDFVTKIAHAFHDWVELIRGPLSKREGTAERREKEKAEA